MPFHRREVILGGGKFDPTNIAGCVLWLAADKLALTDGASVATWTDASGKSNTLTQGTGANQPTFKVNQIKGLPAVYFDGATRYLNRASGSWAQPNTMGLVLQGLLPADGGARIALDGNSTLEFAGKDGPSSNRYFYGGTAIHTSPATAAWEIWTVQFSGASSLFRVNGTQVMSGNVGTNGLTGLRLGYAANNSAPWLGSIAEAVLWNALVTTTDLRKWESSMSTKYGIAVS